MNDTIGVACAEAYARAEFKNTYLLGYRDLPWILRHYVSGKAALDYGCGSGRSTRFLKKLGFECAGVDVSHAMISLAHKNDVTGYYSLIKSAETSFQSSSVDLFFSCFVFLTVDSFSELEKIFLEAKRILKPGGIFCFVTASKYLYIKKYISYHVEQVKALTSSEEIMITLKDIGVSFKNYYWSDEDYRRLLKKAGFELVHFEMPLGQAEEPYNWLDETAYSPYVIYTAKKYE